MGRRRPVPRYKVLRQWMIAVPLFAVLAVVLIFLWDGKTVDERTALVREALDAGNVRILDGQFDRVGVHEMTDGEVYEEFQPSAMFLRRNNASANVLIKKDAQFRDGADGNRREVEIVLVIKFFAAYAAWKEQPEDASGR